MSPTTPLAFASDIWRLAIGIWSIVGCVSFQKSLVFGMHAGAQAARMTPAQSCSHTHSHSHTRRRRHRQATHSRRACRSLAVWCQPMPDGGRTWAAPRASGPPHGLEIALIPLVCAARAGGSRLYVCAHTS